MGATSLAAAAVLAAALAPAPAGAGEPRTLPPVTALEGGVLAAPEGLVLPPGHRIVGHGRIEGDLYTRGEIVGTGAGIELAGSVAGDGRFRGSVRIAGRYSPGRSPAEVHFENLTLAPTATLVIEIGGTEPGTEHDRIVVSDTASLDGTLEVVLIDGFAPSAGERFEFLTAATILGTFAALDLPPVLDVSLGLDQGATALAIEAASAIDALPRGLLPIVAALLLALALGGATRVRTLC